MWLHALYVLSVVTAAGALLLIGIIVYDEWPWRRSTGTTLTFVHYEKALKQKSTEYERRKREALG